MNALTEITPNGDISIPQDLRDRLAWTPGTTLELVETKNGVSLRRRSDVRVFPRTTLDDLKAFPPVSPARRIEEISRLSDEAIRRLLP